MSCYLDSKWNISTWSVVQSEMFKLNLPKMMEFCECRNCSNWRVHHMLLKTIYCLDSISDSMTEVNQTKHIFDIKCYVTISELGDIRSRKYSLFYASDLRRKNYFAVLLASVSSSIEEKVKGFLSYDLIAVWLCLHLFIFCCPSHSLHLVPAVPYGPFGSKNIVNTANQCTCRGPWC